MYTYIHIYICIHILLLFVVRVCACVCVCVCLSLSLSHCLSLSLLPGCRKPGVNRTSLTDAAAQDLHYSLLRNPQDMKDGNPETRYYPCKEEHFFGEALTQLEVQAEGLGLLQSNTTRNHSDLSGRTRHHPQTIPIP